LWLAGRIADRETGPEILHIHGVFSHVTTAAASIARRHDVPYVLRPAGTFDEACYRSNRWWLKEAFASLFTKRDLRKAASVHATSDAEAQTLRRLVPGDRVAVIPHGVELPPLERVQAAQPLYEAFPNLRGQRIVLFMSRLAPKKRPELVVQSMAILRRAGWDLKLLIAGHDAGQEATTRAAVRRCGLDDSVLFVGFLQGDLKRAALAAAEVFVLPSLDENYGVAVVEALAHGTPAVVTPEVAAHTYVDRSGSGRTVDGTASAIASGIAAVISNDARTLGTRGRDFVEQNLSWPAVNRHLEWLYERLLRAPVAVSQKRTTEN
jgi:glycosyltransferase involved in cell wall biosynthesis